MSVQSRLSRLPSLWLFCLMLFGLAGCQSGPSFWPFSSSESPEMTDAEIVHIARTLNEGEVKTSQPAVQKASNAQVRQFAEKMVNQHQNEMQNLERIAQEARVTPLPNDTSTGLQKQAQGVIEKLNKADRGNDFDKTYIQAQITLHQEGLKLLDDTLITSAQNGRIRGYLTQMRTIVNQHLQEAERIEKSLK